MKLAEIREEVTKKLDGRTFPSELIGKWLNVVRVNTATDTMVAGRDGLFFLYVHDALIEGGSIAYNPETDEGRYYLLPDDFLMHEIVYYDGKPLINALTTSFGRTLVKGKRKIEAGEPQFYLIVGLELELIPPPTEAGKEIALDYYAYPETITEATPDNYEDYFMRIAPDLHIYGGAKHGAESLGNDRLLALYRVEFEEAKKKLALLNNMMILKGAHPRFMSHREVSGYWDEGYIRPAFKVMK